MKLAVTLGCASIRELRERTTPREHAELLTLLTLEPLGDDRVDLAAARVAHAVAASTPRKKGTRAPKFSKFLPAWWPRTRPPAERMLKRFHAWARGFRKVDDGDAR